MDGWIRMADWMRRRKPAIPDTGCDAAAGRKVSSTRFVETPVQKMNQTIELLLTRRSVPLRLLSAPAPTPEQITTLLTIASRVPDHGRAVPWRFVVFTPEGAAKLGESIAAIYSAEHPDATETMIETERSRLLRAPLVIAVISSPYDHPKAPEWEQLLSAGAAAMSLVIGVNAMGYGANWHTEWYAYDRRVLAELGLSDSERIAGFIHIGTATERPLDRARPVLNDVVTRY